MEWNTKNSIFLVSMTVRVRARVSYPDRNDRVVRVIKVRFGVVLCQCK